MHKNCLILFLISAALCLAESEKPILFRKPTVSRTQIVFSYAGDLWTVAREGGNATRLTAAPGVETDPLFSPDGSQIAFTGQYDGNTDVYTVSAAGGVPRRPDRAHLGRQSLGFACRDGSTAKQFQRLQPDVDRRHDLLPLRPQWLGIAFCV